MAHRRLGKHNLKACVCAILAGLLFSFSAHSEENKIPAELREIGIDEHRGEGVDLNLTFQDETGQTVPLRTYFQGTKPVLLALVYYGCPNVCTFVLNGVVDSVKKLDLKAGEKYEVVVVSIDPKETPALAAEKKEAYLKALGMVEAEKGWHFLVGKEPNIKKLAGQIGFKYKWVEEQQQYAHSSAVFVLTGEGKISRYLYGIMYPPQDMKLAFLEASDGKIGTFVDRIILFCFYYDTATKKYVLLASRIMTAGGIITLLAMSMFLGRFWLRERSA